MEKTKRYLTGRHTPGEIRRHLVLLVAVYWVLIFCAWRGYVTQNSYSIRTEMLSALGSFEPQFNPRFFWIFSIAMIYCGLCLIPVMLYIYRRFAAISARGAGAGLVLFLTGSVAIILVGLFPYARTHVYGIPLDGLHNASAGLVGFTFLLSIPWHAVLIIRDRYSNRAFAVRPRAPYRPYIGPFLICAPMIFLILYHVKWGALHDAVMAGMRASVPEALQHLKTAVSVLAYFPLLEHSAIWVLMVFIVWITVVLPYPHEGAPAQ